MYYFVIALIIATSVAFLILHQRLERRLRLVEAAFALLEDALREQMDLIEDGEPVTESERHVHELAKNYNDTLAPYNAMLDKFPWRLYAPALMIKREEPFSL